MYIVDSALKKEATDSTEDQRTDSVECLSGGKQMGVRILVATGWTAGVQTGSGAHWGVKG
jgi:hypothetical protein